jgi:hypothetical protein
MNDAGPRHRHRRHLDEVRESVLADVRLLKESAAAAARSPHVSDDDKATLRDATELLDRSVDNLIRILEQYDVLLEAISDPRAAARLAACGPFVLNGLVDLSSLVFAASAIGNLALGTSVRRDELMRKLRERTAAASSARRAKSSEKIEVILNYADQVWREHPDWSPWRVAGEIIKPVRDELERRSAALGAKKPSGASSRNTIYKVLLER